MSGDSGCGSLAGGGKGCTKHRYEKSEKTDMEGILIILHMQK